MDGFDITFLLSIMEGRERFLVSNALCTITF